MKNSHQFSISVQVADVGVKTHRKTDETIPKNNPMIDVRLLEEFRGI